MVGAALTVLSLELDVYGAVVAVAAAVACFLIRMVAVRFDLNAPRPPDPGPRG